MFERINNQSINQSKYFLLYDTGKLCSKLNNVTMLSTDAGRRDGRLLDFIFCPWKWARTVSRQRSAAAKALLSYQKFSKLLLLLFIARCC